MPPDESIEPSLTPSQSGGAVTVGNEASTTEPPSSVVPVDGSMPNSLTVQGPAPSERLDNERSVGIENETSSKVSDSEEQRENEELNDEQPKTFPQKVCFLSEVGDGCS